MLGIVLKLRHFSLPRPYGFWSASWIPSQNSVHIFRFSRQKQLNWKFKRPTSGRPNIFFPGLMKCRFGSRVREISCYLFNKILVRIEIPGFLNSSGSKFRIDPFFFTPGGHPDQNILMAEVECVKQSIFGHRRSHRLPMSVRPFVCLDLFSKTGHRT